VSIIQKLKRHSDIKKKEHRSTGVGYHVNLESVTSVEAAELDANKNNSSKDRECFSRNRLLVIYVLYEYSIIKREGYRMSSGMDREFER
jgi:hypothetical protein